MAQEIETLRRKNERLQKDCVIMAKEGAKLQRTCTDLRHELNNPGQEIADLREVNEELTTELQQAKHDLTFLKWELDVRRAPPLTNSE